MFKPNHSYALRDPERYDDEFGEGYGRAIAGPSTMEGAWLTDCWIANDQGKVHPGYSACPVPIRFEDVVEESAKAFVGDLPRPASLMDSSFFR